MTTPTFSATAAPCPAVTASVPLLDPPGWAVAQRQLFDLLDRAWRRCEPDSKVFSNWPQLYLLGGAEDLLTACERHWERVAGRPTGRFPRGESPLTFHFLCMAAPERWREHAIGFAELCASARTDAGRRARSGVQDAAADFAAAGLVCNALLMSGQDRYRERIAERVGTWLDRAAADGGVLPDNAAMAGALAAVHATGDASYLDAVRLTLDAIIARGRTAQLSAALDIPVPHGPFPREDHGWFDVHPMLTGIPTALWHHSAATADRQRLERLRAGSGYDWCTMRPIRSEEEAGHEEPWLAFLCGDDPGYPERVLAAAQAQVRHRLARMDRYRDRETGPANGQADSRADSLNWQRSNPVVTEALVQLTWGGPQVVSDGGLQQARVRYHDAEARRPGLPPSVAALVSGIDRHATLVELVNLDPERPRAVIVQAGAFGEHTIGEVRHSLCDDPSRLGGYGPGLPAPTVTTAVRRVDGPYLRIDLPPSSLIRLSLELELRTRTPSYRTPFDAREEGS
ncbi:MAG: hypothetical protein HOW97_17450 [Catenulispora sp.]|nr:hypothetical protein [Catenulispora sp.]